MADLNQYPIIHEQFVAWGVWMLLVMSIIQSITVI